MRPLITLHFPEPLMLWPLEDDRAVTLEPIEVWAELWNGQCFLIALIEKGFVFDGVSRPGIFAWWIKRWGPETEEALLHDWLLELLSRGVIGKPKFLIDLFFLMALVCGRRSFLRSTIMFLSVRTRPART